jgi:dethiobiotin synthetase
MKPIETGLSMESGELAPMDGAFLRRAAEADDAMELITPARFAEPLAPYVAAARAGARVDLERVFNAYERLSRKYAFMVVEGAGGAMVPIMKRQGETAGGYYMLDLIKDLKLDALVVTRPSLGSVNHTLLTVSRLLDEGICVKGVIVNYSEPPDGSVAEETNIETLREFCPAPVIAELPYMQDVTMAKLDEKAREIRGAIDHALIPR